ncbi:MAG: hypothetical protein WA210_10265, partial [Burkholderiaceae bacterium]
ATLEQRWDGARLVLRVPLSAQRSESPASMRAVLVARGEHAGVALDFAVQGGWPAPGERAAHAQAISAEVQDTSWRSVVLLALAALGIGWAVAWLRRR